MKFGLVFGHAASNLGDLAINTGAIRLLRSVAPQASIHVVFLSPSPAYTNAAIASLGDAGVTYTMYAPVVAEGPEGEREDRAIARVLWAPDEFLAATGLDACTTVFYNSGEHLFSSESDENIADLLWRSVALHAIKASGKRFVVLPSTFGPLAGEHGQRLLRGFLRTADSAAGREAASAELMRSTAGAHVNEDWLLDPAFFLPDTERAPAARRGAPRKLGLVLRIEDHGLRVGKQASAKAMTAHRKAAFNDSRAYQLAMSVADHHLPADDEATIDVFVQTLADRDLAQAIAAAVSERHGEGRVRVYQPASVSDYMKRLAELDYVVSSRFHACILSFLGGTPAFGIFTRAHGHKLPALYEGLGLGPHCLCMDDDAPGEIGASAHAAYAGMARAMTSVHGVVTAKREQTASWLRHEIRARQAKRDLPGFVRDIGGALDALAASSDRAAADSRKKSAELERETERTRIEGLMDKMQEAARMHVEYANATAADRSGQSTLMAGMFDKLDSLVGELRARTDEGHAKAGEFAVLQERMRHQDAEIVRLHAQLSAAAADLERMSAVSDGKHALLLEEKEESSRLREALARVEGEIVLRDHRIALQAVQMEGLHASHEKDLSHEKRARHELQVRIGHMKELDAGLKKEIAALRQDVARLKGALQDNERQVSQERKLSHSMRERESAVAAQVEALSAELASEKGQSMALRANLSEVNRHEQASRQLHRELEFLVSGRTRELHLLQHELDELRNSIRFKIGTAIAGARSSPKAMLSLPLTLVRIVREMRPVVAPEVLLPQAEDTPPSHEPPEKASSVDVSDADAPSSDPASATVAAETATVNDARNASVDFVLPPDRSVLPQDGKQQLDTAIKHAWQHAGAEGVIDFCLRVSGSARPELQAFCLARGAAFLGKHGALEQELRLAELAHKVQVNPMTVAAHLCAAYHVCDYPLAMELVGQLRGWESELSRYQRQLIDEVSGYASLVEEAERDRAEPMAGTVDGRSVYFLHSSLPHLSGGYALRAHGLIGGTMAAGWDIRPYTRPGFPGDTGKTVHEPVDIVDGIAYKRTSSEVTRNDGEYRYMHACVPVFEQVLADERPEVVHGRSTYLISLPALIAARRSGLPFVYEVSGLWEMVHESRDDAELNRRRTERMRFLETVVARLSDRVITLTEPMREELIARGVDPRKIVLVPNSVNPDRYLPAPRDEALAARLMIPDGVPVIGYVGSFIDYEGLDDLVAAAEGIAAQGIDFRLLLVGDGAEFGNLRALVDASTIRDKVIMTGRVAHDTVPSYYSLIDVCPFPRKPWEVCEVVSPMKPFEPMAMGKAVVVSGTRALRDIVHDRETGLVFEKGSVEALVQVLVALIRDPALRERLGASAMEWVKRERSWNSMGKRVIEQYADARRVV